MNFFEFALKSPFLSFIIICAVYYAWKAPWVCLKRAIRSRDIQTHGWPKAPMDADGDIVTNDGE